jgi:hypothetical protein
MLGTWYGPRKECFRQGRALRYRRSSPPGVTVSGDRTNVVATAFEDGYLLHLINMTGKRAGLTIRLKGRMWLDTRGAFLKPVNREADIRIHPGERKVRTPAEEIDPVDTILFVR